jgi:hypothetical protein
MDNPIGKVYAYCPMAERRAPGATLRRGEQKEARLAVLKT